MQNSKKNVWDKYYSTYLPKKLRIFGQILHPQWAIQTPKTGLHPLGANVGGGNEEGDVVGMTSNIPIRVTSKTIGQVAMEIVT